MIPKEQMKSGQFYILDTDGNKLTVLLCDRFSFFLYIENSDKRNHPSTHRILKQNLRRDALRMANEDEISEFMNHVQMCQGGMSGRKTIDGRDVEVNMSWLQLVIFERFMNTDLGGEAKGVFNS